MPVDRGHVATPRCLHGEPWKPCSTCAHQAWCEDCFERIELDEPPHPRETVTCMKCVDRMIGKAAA